MATPTPLAGLSDEDLDKAIEEGLKPGEVKEPETPEAPETPEEPEAPEEPEEPEKPEEPIEAEEPEEPAEEEPKPPSRREQLRIQDLLKKYPQAPPAAPKATPPGAFDIERDVDADPELKQKLMEDRKQAVDAARNQGLEIANSLRFHTRLEVDAPRIEQKYPALDKESDKFKPQLANAINTMYLSTVGYDSENDTVQNPNIRYSEYVESVYELASEIAGEQTVATKTNIKKQAAKTGLRPDGSKSKPALNLNKLPHQMSDEELDAAIALGIPSR